MSTATETQERPVIVCTEHRGVFFGYATDTTGDRINLRAARMAIYFGTQRGVMQLAGNGPDVVEQDFCPREHRSSQDHGGVRSHSRGG